MDIRVFNQSRTEAHVIGEFESLVWSPAYTDKGSFELKLEKKYTSIFKDDMVLEIGADTVFQGLFTYMEDMNDSAGELLTVKGHFLTDILSYRVIPYTMEFTDQSIRTIIESLLRLTFWSSIPERHVDNIQLDFLTEGLESEILTCVTDAGDLQTILYTLGSVHDFGTNVYIDDDLIYHLQIYRGVDRTAENNLNPLVFSKDRDTATQVSYVYDNEYYKNFAYISAKFNDDSINNNAIVSLVGSDSGSSDSSDLSGIVIAGRTANDTGTYVYEFDKEHQTGLARREVFVEADVRTEENTSLSEFRNLVISSGEASLGEYLKTDFLECEISDRYSFGVDFGLGDSVTIDSVSLGISMSARIDSIERIWDSQGYSESVTIGSQKGLIRYVKK